MSLMKSDAAEILERLYSSYGVSSQKALSEKLGIPSNNISGWTQRNSVPGDAIISCALDTGADLGWLATGKFANANFSVEKAQLKGRILYEQIQSTGGKPVLRRMLDAYGFKTQKELGELFGISTATISTWVRREYFPGDAVVACALDTGCSLLWLATGEGTPISIEKLAHQKIRILKRMCIDSGELIESGTWVVDSSFINVLSENIRVVTKDNCSWIVDFDDKKISNGRWLIGIDESYDIYDVIKMPNNVLKMSTNKFEFTCSPQDVECIGKVNKTIENN
ncbi:phage repressor protein CI [Serratia marcescens]|uniref:phage repressor protein CI n=1 Tax=Serratia marcescens TaxID=615 RepID=UPI00320B257E